MGTIFGPKYIPYNYMEPLGNGAHVRLRVEDMGLTGRHTGISRG